MSAKLTLSVVDQSPVRAGGNAGDALRETIQLAVAVEKLGYYRYWLAEHHNLPNFAGTSPEVLVGQVAAHTNSIRVGSGGVMLSHYSALKVAENFRMLESLYPGRIDLGVGRAPGSDHLTAAALSYPGSPNDVQHYPRQVVDLVGYLNGGLESEHPFAQVQAGPDRPQGAPEVWLLGSRYESAYMAAKLGMPLPTPTSSAWAWTRAPPSWKATASSLNPPSSWMSLKSTSGRRCCAPKPRRRHCASPPAATWAASTRSPTGPRASPRWKRP